MDDAASRAGEDTPGTDGVEAPPDDADAPPHDGEEPPVDEALLRDPLEPGSPSLENAAFVLLGMVAALVVWLLLLP